MAVVIAVSVKQSQTNKKGMILNLNSSKRKVGNSNIAQNHSELIMEKKKSLIWNSIIYWKFGITLRT